MQLVPPKIRRADGSQRARANLSEAAKRERQMTITQEQKKVMAFTTIQSALGRQFKAMSSKRLFATAVDGAALWDKYLASFPAGSNQIYKKRTEHDCSCCRHFIKNIGGVVNIVDGKIVTLWDFKVDGPYQEVVDAMAEYIRGHAIDNVYLHYERMVGTAKSNQLLEDKKTVKSWDHYYVNLPDSAVVKKDQIGPQSGEFRATHDVMKRGLEEILPSAVETVLELIAQNSLYRGEEQKFALEEFRKLQRAVIQAANIATTLDLFAWERMDSVPQSVSRIRNTAIGALLVDLSGGMDLEDAVKAFESKVAPTNYKRPTALVTKAMIAKAQKTVDELGLTTALERRYATLDDITVANILFADRETKKAMNVFDDLAAGVAVDEKKLGKVEEVSIADFITKILPTAKTVEALFENRHSGNMVSLVAPVDPTAKHLFKWPNGFSWSYQGDLADSIKERVKQAGGSVTGDFRASLAWFNYDDLDLHLRGPNGLYIWFRDKNDSKTGGALDVDMNANRGTSRSAVENITFPKRERMAEGEYILWVNQFCQRESIDGGFEIEMEFDGTVYGFSWPNLLKATQNVVVCKFQYSRKDGLKILESLPSKQASKTVWGLPTQAFHKVRVVMLSPNQWDGCEIGNRHWFFMLDKCANEGTARGFYNEFLGAELTPHRKVLEMVGAKMKTETSDRQLSGLGFSSTKRDSLLCRVSGSFSRIVKIVF
jgi:hypothetical protein